MNAPASAPNANVATSPALPRGIQDTVDAANKIAENMAAQRVAADTPPTPAPAAAPTPAPVEPPMVPEDTFLTNPNIPDEVKNQYRSMKGRDLRARQRTAELERKVREAEEAAQREAQARSLANEGATPSPSDGFSSATLFTEEQRKEYGDEFFEILDKHAAAREAAHQAELLAERKRSDELSARVQHLSNNVMEVRAQPVYSTLDKEIPQWRALNKDPDFLSWLDHTPASPSDNTPMLVSIRSAFEANDAPTVAGIFRQYLVETGQTPSPQSHQPPPPPAAAYGRPTVSMESLAGPGTPQSGNDAPASNANAKIWTDAGIQAFYEDVRKNKLDSAQARAIEADLQYAISTQGRQAGRYRPK